MYAFEIFEDKAGEYRFRFLPPSGEPMFVSEGYKATASAQKTIDSIKRNAGGAQVRDATTAVA